MASLHRLMTLFEPIQKPLVFTFFGVLFFEMSFWTDALEAGVLPFGVKLLRNGKPTFFG